MAFQRPKIKDFTGLFKQDPNKFIEEVLRGGFTTVQPKYDGRWGILKCDGTHTTLHTRHGKLWKRWLTPHLPSFEIHGEHLFGTAWAKDHPEYESLIAFDIVMYEDQPVASRLKKNMLLRELCEQDLGATVRLCEVDYLEVGMPRTTLQHFRMVFNDWTEKGMEGVMLRSSKTTDLIRIKPVYEMDYVLMGFKQSDAPKYHGKMVRSVIGGLWVDGKLKEVCNVSGLNEEQRADFYRSPDQYIGKVFTASGKGVFSSGALRHPNFVRFHPTKLSEECVHVVAR